jgi:4-methylaminobutanoate oxidase (formaldehyde-forming)
MGKEIGFEIEHVNRTRAEKLLPCMKSDDIIEFCYCPTDGHFQPAELLAAYVKVARERGTKFLTQTCVESIEITNGAVHGVRVGGRLYSAPIVVNAAGPWSHLLSDLADLPMPTAAIGHYYFITHPIATVPIGQTDAALRDRENRIYTRPEVGGLLVGSYESEPVIYDMKELGTDFEMGRMKPARDSINVAMLLDSASRRFPFIDNTTPMNITTGIMTFTPDGFALCGPVCKVSGLFDCTGFNGRGVFQSAASGRIMSDLILDGQCRYPVSHLDAERMDGDPNLKDRKSINAACYNRYSNHYGSGSPDDRRTGLGADDDC